jgi:hypothetical protein
MNVQRNMIRYKIGGIPSSCPSVVKIGFFSEAFSSPRSTNPDPGRTSPPFSRVETLRYSSWESDNFDTAKVKWGLSCKISDKVPNAALKAVISRTTVRRTKSTHNGHEAYTRAESRTHNAKEGGKSKCVW